MTELTDGVTVRALRHALRLAAIGADTDTALEWRKLDLNLEAVAQEVEHGPPTAAEVEFIRALAVWFRPGGEFHGEPPWWIRRVHALLTPGERPEGPALFERALAAARLRVSGDRTGGHLLMESPRPWTDAVGLLLVVGVLGEELDRVWGEGSALRVVEQVEQRNQEFGSGDERADQAPDTPTEGI
jgi:hypothetical protein